MVLGDVSIVVLERDLHDVDDGGSHGRGQAEDHPQYVARALPLRLQRVHVPLGHRSIATIRVGRGIEGGENEWWLHCQNITSN